MRKLFIILIIFGIFSISSIFAGFYVDSFDSSKRQSFNLENMSIFSSDVTNYPINTKSQLPIHISSEDFVNGIHFTDLNAIDAVSKESIIVVSGILEYDE